ncbi:MAG: hypothetical protein GF334_04180 [Candidatus Altiarchaeales archaeon]|nr:hypothetical protein [Candidatus Altiarchaeales archaeon]
MPTNHEIREHDHEWRLCHHEPIPALTKDGETRTADRLVSVMVYEAIDCQREIAKLVKPEKEFTEYELLESYITTHHAWVITNKGEHYVKETEPRSS